MPTEQEKHTKWNEVKISIIEFILDSSGIVPEPKIREYLKKKHKITNQGNIKKHLSDLRYRPYSCIEIIPAKPGFANHWDIKKVENLKNIRHHFPEIKLNKYNKSLDIFLNESVNGVFSFDIDLLRSQLSESTSFFDVFIGTDMEALYARAWEIYKLDTGFDRYQKVRKYMNEICSEYEKSHPNVKMSEEMFLKLCREQPTEILEAMPKELYIETVQKIAEILSWSLNSYLSCLNTIFEHCVIHDILMGVASPEEIELMRRKKEANVLVKMELEKDPMTTVKKLIQDNRLGADNLSMLVNGFCASLEKDNKNGV
jgi:hypothetical protein